MGFIFPSENPFNVTNYESASPYESTNLRMFCLLAEGKRYVTGIRNSLHSFIRTRRDS